MPIGVTGTGSLLLYELTLSERSSEKNNRPTEYGWVLFSVWGLCDANGGGSKALPRRKCVSLLPPYN